MLRNRVRDSYNSLKHRTVSGAKQLKESQLLEYFNQDYKLTEAEKNELRQSILDKSARNLKIAEFNEGSPLVSIIIINSNGVKHLRRLFKDFTKKSSILTMKS